MPVLTPAELWEQDRPHPDPRALQAPGPRRPRLRPLDDARGDGHVPLRASSAPTATCRSPLPLPDEGARRAAPRGGLLRVREFVMKDSYSFDRDEAGLDVRFQKHKGAYERIFERCGIEAVAVQAESGMMGGSESIDYLAPVRLRREHARHLRERRLRGRSRDRARRAARAPSFPERARRARRGRDAWHHDDRGARRLPRHRRCGDVEGDAGVEGRRHARARARPRRRPPRGGEARGGARRRIPPRDRRRDPRGVRRRARARSARSASRARSSPTRRCAKGSSSPARTAPAGTCAASEHGRDFTAAVRRHPRAVEGDTCPSCGGALAFQTAIEVGHIFKLGTHYSAPLGATFLDERRQGAAGADGQLRHRPGPGAWRRSSSSSTTRTGSSGPGRSRRTTCTCSPWQGHRPRCGGRRSSRRRAALAAAGYDVLLDDRDAAPGREVRRRRPARVPVRVTVGKKSIEDGAVDVRRRTDRCGRARCRVDCD